MSRHLSYGKFEWYPTNHITEELITSLPDDSEIGYIFGVDLQYSKHLHKLHNAYFVSSERVTVAEEFLSPYAKSLLKKKSTMTHQNLYQI